MLRRFLTPRRGAARRPARRLTIQTLEAREVPAAFTPGNIVIYRTGDGINTLGSTGNPVFLDEYTPSGTLVQSIAMPTAASGANKQLIAVGNATAEGLMTRSADGGYLMLGGYAADPGGSTGLAGSSPATIPRTVGRVAADGSVDTSLTLTDLPANAGAVRGVASADGNAVWVSTTNTGVWYAPYTPGTTSTQLNNTVTTMRYVNVFDGQLYAAANATGFRIGTAGTGLPTTSGQTFTNLPGFVTAGSAYAFFFADLDPGVPGPDTLYWVDDGTASGVTGGLEKFSLVSGNWVSNGIVGASGDNYRGLTATVSGTTVTLFATRKGSELVSLVDASGYNATLTGTPTLLASAGTKQAFRGVALTPEEVNTPPFNTVRNQTTSEDVGITVPGLAVADPDAGSANVKVTFTVAEGQLSLLDNVTGGVTAAQITANNGPTVSVTAPLAAINATLQNGTTGGLLYFPAGDRTGAVTVTMTTDDLGNTGPGGARTDTDTFTVTMNPVDDSPVNTVPGAQSVNEDTDLVFSAANGNAISMVDVDAGTAPVQVTLTATHGLLTLGGTTNLTVTGNGTATVVATGALADLNAGLAGLKFTPDGNYSGAATLQIVTDDQGNSGSGGPKSDTDSVAITVNAVNDPPAVTPATFTVNQNAADGTLVGTVVAADVEGDAFTFAITAGNTNGAFAIDPANGKVTVANASAVTGGPFALTVSATDTGSATGSATVTVNVNTPPTISQPIGDRFGIEDGAPIVVELGPVFADAEDADTALTFTVPGNSDPSLFSSVAVTGTTLTLTLAPEANGLSVVTVRATDTLGLSVDAVSVMNVTPVNDAPTLDAIGSVVIGEDAAQQTVNLAGISAGPANEAGQTLTVEATSDNPALIPNPTVTYGGGGTATLKFTPAPDASGTATLTVTVRDDGGTANSGVDNVVRTFTVTVNPVNDPPTLDPIDDVLIDEDSPQQVIDLTGISAGPADESGQTVTVTAVSDNPALVPNPTVTYIGGATGLLAFAPTADASGTANVTVTVDDGAGGTFVRTFAITVAPVNDTPAVSPATFTVPDHAAIGTVVGAVTATDVEGDTLFFAITDGDPDGAFAIDADTGVITVLDDTLVTGGPFSLTVEVTDDGLPNETGSAVILVNVDAAPTTTGVPDRTVLEDSGQFTIDLAAAFEDAEDGDALTYTIPADSNPGLFSPAPAVTGTSLKLTPAPDAFGQSTLTVRATDTSGQFVEATFTVTVTGVNDAPTLDAIGNVPIDEDAPQQTVNLSGIGAGPGNETGQSLTITAVSDNPGLIPNPTVNYAGGATGSLNFTPVPDANGSANVTVTVTDNGGTANGGANSFTRTFTVTVGSEADRPVLDTAGTPMLPPEPVFSKVLAPGGLISDLTENVTDADAGALRGVAIVAADTAKGKWQFKPGPDPAPWTDFPTDLSPTNALLLADDGDTRVRFVPKPLFNGFASLTFKAWDQSNGAREGVDRDDTTDAADISYSAATDRGWVTVGRTTPKVDADGRTVIPTIREDSSLPRVVAVKSVLGLAKLEALPKTNLGIAVTAASTATGTWQFRLAGTTQWVDVGPVPNGEARLLRPTDVLRFKPAANADGDATLTFKVWDQTVGTAGTLAPVTGTAFGTDPGAAVLDIKPVNDAPVLDLSHPAVLNPVGPGGTTNAATLGSLMAATDVEGAAVGVAVFQASGPGTWHYRPAGGTDTILPRVSALKALLLAADTEVWFEAAPGALPATAKLSFRAWDRSNGKAVGSLAPIAGSAFSKQVEVLTVAVGNTRPVLDTSGSPTLPDVIAGSTGGTGASVKALLGTAVTDLNPSPGIAITGADNANGTWQYSLGLGPWIAVGNVSKDAALLLANTARVRFVPNAGFTGTATIEYKAWDRTAGMVGDRIDTDSGLDSFSVGFETAQVTVK